MKGQCPRPLDEQDILLKQFIRKCRRARKRHRAARATQSLFSHHEIAHPLPTLPGHSITTACLLQATFKGSALFFFVHGLQTVKIPCLEAIHGLSSTLMNMPKTSPPSAASSTALVVIRPEEGRRLIGRAVAQLPQVQARTQTGRMVIVGGSTTRHVAWSLTGEDPGQEAFAVGWIREGLLGETPRAGRGPGPVLFEEGVMTRGWPGDLLQRFGKGDIYIKGANAMDAQGHTAVLMGSPTGGTIGAAMTILLARGGELIIPISLQKTIPSVPAACGLLGQGCLDRVMGSEVGYMPLMAGTATVVTEISALRLLTGVQATPVAAGGLDDCTGALVLHLKGDIDAVDAAWNMLTQLRSGDLQTDDQPIRIGRA